MKRYLVILIALIIVLSAAVAYGAGKVDETADRIEFRLETMYGDPAAANGVEISGMLSAVRTYDTAARKESYFCWTSTLGIEDGKLLLKNVTVEKSVDYYELFDRVAIKTPLSYDTSVDDLDGSCIYRCYYQDGTYNLEIRDKKTDAVTFTTKVDSDNLYSDKAYPKLFAGHGSAVLALVRKDSYINSNKSVLNSSTIICVTSDGKMISTKLRTYEFNETAFYPFGGTGFIVASSSEERFVLVKRDPVLVHMDGTGDDIVYNLTYPQNSPEIWVFSPDGLEFMGICRCSLDDRPYSYVDKNGEEQQISFYEYSGNLEAALKVTW